MTLTTEQIEQVIDDCRKGAAMRGLFNKWIVEEMASELLRCRDRLAELSAQANREAQPVGYFVRHRSAWDRPSKWSLWTECSAEDYAEFCKIIATGEDDAGRFYDTRILYDAPPAPAVVKLPTEFYSDEGIVVRLEQVMAALAVVGVKYERKGGACRSAMLAQPVSSGYKLNSPEIPDGWKLVPIDATRAMIDAAQRVEEDGYDAMHKAMLAAAPEVK